MRRDADGASPLLTSFEIPAAHNVGTCHIRSGGFLNNLILCLNLLW